MNIRMGPALGPLGQPGGGSSAFPANSLVHATHALLLPCAPPPLPGVRPTHEIERLIQLQDKNGTARFRVRFARAVPASTIA